MDFQKVGPEKIGGDASLYKEIFLIKFLCESAWISFWSKG